MITYQTTLPVKSVKPEELITKFLIANDVVYLVPEWKNFEKNALLSAEGHEGKAEIHTNRAGEMAVKVTVGTKTDIMTISKNRITLKLISDDKNAKPEILSVLYGLLDRDNGDPITQYPEMINKSNLTKLSDLVLGKHKYNLPIIYVSKTKENMDPVNTMALADNVAGLAHVWVEEGTWLKDVINEACENKCITDGGVAIYFPDEKNLKVEYKKPENEIYSKSITNFIKRNIRTHMYMSDSDKCSEIFAESYQIELKKITAEKEKLQKELAETKVPKPEVPKPEEQKTVTIVNDRSKELTEKITKQANKITALTAENEGLRNKIGKNGALPLLIYGSEKDYFTGEVKDIVLHAIKSEYDSTKKDTRRADVLKDVIEANGYMNLCEDRAARIKNTMKNYKAFTSSMRSELSDLGWNLTDDNKHIKALYHNNNRYFVSLAKTPSDTRAGLNAALELIQKSL